MARMTCSSFSPICWIITGSLPATLMPTGVLIPVASMLIRFLIGMTQMLLNPGNLTMRSSSAIKSAVVTPGRHPARGFN